MCKCTLFSDIDLRPFIELGSYIPFSHVRSPSFAVDWSIKSEFSFLHKHTPERKKMFAWIKCKKWPMIHRLRYTVIDTIPNMTFKFIILYIVLLVNRLEIGFVCVLYFLSTSAISLGLKSYWIDIKFRLNAKETFKSVYCYRPCCDTYIFMFSTRVNSAY